MHFIIDNYKTTFEIIPERVFERFFNYKTYWVMFFLTKKRSNFCRLIYLTATPLILHENNRKWHTYMLTNNQALALQFLVSSIECKICVKNLLCQYK
jgi:hypothetical protein